MKFRITQLALALGSCLVAAYWLWPSNTTGDMAKTSEEAVVSTPANTATANENLAAPLFEFSEKNPPRNNVAEKRETREDASESAQNVPSEDEIMQAYVNTGNPQQVMELYAERRRARATLLQRQMDQENLDPQWAEKLTQSFDQVEQVLPGFHGVSLSQADCRQSICALHLDFETPNEYKRLAPVLGSAGRVLGSDSFVHFDAKPQGAVLYLSREDAQLPDMTTDS